VYAIALLLSFVARCKRPGLQVLQRGTSPSSLGIGSCRDGLLGRQAGRPHLKLAGHLRSAA
jgi:hypothetical protein